MARVTDLNKVELKNYKRDRTTCAATYAVTKDGVLLRTFGSSDREFPQKASQVIHITRNQLAAMLAATTVENDS